jgi:hypothetical protein
MWKEEVVAYVRYYPNMMWKTRNLPVEIRSKHLWNASLKMYRYAVLLGNVVPVLN